MTDQERQATILQLVMEPLRQALLKENLDEENIITEFAQIIRSPDTRPADKLRAIELVSKWAGWVRPETKNLNIKSITVGTELPAELEDM